MHLDRVIAEVDIDQLNAILLQVASRIEGFGPGDIDQLCADVAELEPDDDALLEPDIFFSGASHPFVVDVFKDADGALEVVFLVSSDLRPLVEEAAWAVVGKSAVRSLVA